MSVAARTAVPSTTPSSASSRACTSRGRPRPRRSRACSCSTRRWPRSWASTGSGPGRCWPATPSPGGRDAGRPGLRRPPVRRLLAAARRRARAAARRGARRPRPPPRPAPQGLGPHAVRPRRRRQGGRRADAARVRDRRGDARARHPHDAGARGRRDRRAASCARRCCPARCSRASPPATCASARSSTRRGARRPRRSCGASPTTRSPATTRTRRGREPVPRVLRGRRRGAGVADRPLDARRLHPRRDEHRQHDDLRRDDRLRPVRVHGRLRPGDGLQLDRPRRPLRLRQPAADRAVEPRAAGRDAAAADRRRDRRGGRRGHRGAGSLPRPLRRHWRRGMRAKLGLARRRPRTTR